MVCKLIVSCIWDKNTQFDIRKIYQNPYFSDQTSYEMDQLKDEQTGKFINLVTMQNHLLYDQYNYNKLSQYKALKVSAGTNIDSALYKQKQLLHNYRLVQYDVTAGKHYVVNSMK